MMKPLEDRTNGRLRGWPGGGFYYGAMYTPTFRPARDDDPPGSYVAPDKKHRKEWCNNCNQMCEVVVLHEFVGGVHTEQDICADCACGVNPPVECV